MLVCYNVYSCVVWDRWDKSLQLGAGGLKERTLESMKTCALLPPAKSKEQLGCLNLPLLNVQLDHIVVDELHLLLRVSDRLIDNLVVRAAELDIKCRQHCTGVPNNISRLQQAITSCGVYFKVTMVIYTCACFKFLMVYMLDMAV